jgi:membrane protein YqaA with SNARE-associated domain
VGDEKTESFSEKVGTMVDDAERDIREAAGSIGPALQQAGSSAGDAARQAAGKAGDLAGAALGAGAAQVSRFGQFVSGTWRFVERQASPPWVLFKVLFWAAVVTLILLITVVAYQFKYGILTLPIVELAGGQFVGWMVSLGPIGLFAFTVIGTLFFMVIPTEPFFFIVLNSPGSPVLAVVAAALGSTVGSCANYAMGSRLRRSAGKGTGDQRKLGKWGKRAHSKAGTVLLFAAAALPLPEIVALAYGLADYPFKRFVAVTLAARFVKWTWIAAAFFVFRTAIQ